MKKLLITLIVILTILAIAQGIYYKVNTKTDQINIPQETNDISENQVKNSIYAYGMINLYENYKPNLSLEEFQNKMYNFIYIDLPQIYADTLEMNTDKIKDYYKEKNINQSIGIHSEEDFLMIVKQLQNIYHTQENIVLTETRIDTQSIKRNPNGLIDFNVTLNFDNETKLKIKVILSEQDKTFLILSNSNLDRIFETYSGDITKENVLEKIDNLVDNVDKIRQNTTLRTENEKKQYFDLNKDDMASIGISTQEDFINVANQINCMQWIYGTLRFQNYEIDYESLVQDENYSNFKVILYYNYDSKIDIIISIRNSRNVEPKIKLSGDTSDFQYESNIEE